MPNYPDIASAVSTLLLGILAPVTTQSPQVILLLCHASRPRGAAKEESDSAVKKDFDTVAQRLEARDVRASNHVEGSEGSKVTLDEYYDATYQNKAVIMETGAMREAIMVALSAGLRSSSGHLVVKGLIDIMAMYLLPPQRHTTATPHYDALLEDFGQLRGQLFQLFFHPSLSVMANAGLLMEAITRDASAEQAAQMQRTALKEGAFLKHMHLSIFSEVAQQRDLSRRLVKMFADNSQEVTDVLRQMFPRGLLHFLRSKSVDSGAGEGSEGPRTREEIIAQKREKKLLLRRQMDSAAGAEDADTSYSQWEALWEVLPQDFHRGDLMWNDTTRQELCTALEAEIEALGLHEQAAVITEPISWNYNNFEVLYPSLEREPKIGNLYLMRLLERRHRDDKVEARLLQEVARDGSPERFFNWAFERFLLEHDDDVKATCCRIMTIVYRAHHTQLPAFRAVGDIVKIIDLTPSNKLRDNLLVFVQALLYEPLNMKSFLNAGGIALVVELMTLVHWDDSIKVAAANLPANQPVMMLEDSEEPVQRDYVQYWFYKVPAGLGAKKDERAGQEVGPISISTLDGLWKTGAIDGDTEVHTKHDWQWRPLSSLRVLRWRFMMRGTSNFSPVAVAEACLDIMLQLCGSFPVADEFGVVMRPLPRARVMLSDMSRVLPHIVQVLVTQHAGLISKASQLVQLILEQNTELASRLYRTGLFCFAFMYTGSNVLPLIELVKATHHLQRFQGFKEALGMSAEDVVRGSILSTIFPDSLVLYLAHRSSHDFARMYLGEHDSPELIWTQGMRDVLMMELAQHTSDFVWQLREYPMSVYDYEPVPAVAFEELKEEVWLHTVYLRNLADTTRFPYWKIHEPVQLLRALLTHWNGLLRADPSALTDATSYKLLGVEPGVEAQVLKKAFRKLAIKYHPDKNPDGHEMFMKVQKAYEHLTSKKGVGEDKNVEHQELLVLGAHVVLYRQHLANMAPYKYAGYTMLLGALRLQDESPDGTPFEGDALKRILAGLTTTLLTVRCARPNAEEFCRMGGVAILEALFNRCTSLLTLHTERSDPLIAVASLLARTWLVLLQDTSFVANDDAYHNKGLPASDYQEPHPQTPAMPPHILLRALARCLRCTQAPGLVRSTVACLAALASASTALRLEATARCGVLWALLPLLSHFDPEGKAFESLASDYKYIPLNPLDVSEHGPAGWATNVRERGASIGAADAVAAVVTADESYTNQNLTQAQARDALAREAAQCLATFAIFGSDSGASVAHQALLALLRPAFVSQLVACLNDGGAAEDIFLQSLNGEQQTCEAIWGERHVKQLTVSIPRYARAVAHCARMHPKA